MIVGHINLARSVNGIGEHFITLIEELDRRGVKQHIVVSNHALASRLSVCRNVVVGPVVNSPLMAFCFLQKVDLAHVHDDRSGQAGLLLTLIRSTPFVITRRGDFDPKGKSPVRAIYRRAAGLICRTDADAAAMLEYEPGARIDVIADIIRRGGSEQQMIARRAAADHLRAYRRAVDTWTIPSLLS